jgi:hypothetical protein
VALARLEDSARCCHANRFGHRRVDVQH